MQIQPYPRTAVILHWILAVSIFFLFLSSWWMLGLPLPSKELTFRALPFQLHKNIGITLIFVLALLLYVRVKHRPKVEAPEVMVPWMRKLAIADHVLLYLLAFATCFSGLMSSLHTRWNTTVWWVVGIPRMFEPSEELNEFFSNIHLWTAWGLLAVTSVHISGAVYHAFRNDGIVRRMLR